MRVPRLQTLGVWLWVGTVFCCGILLWSQLHDGTRLDASLAGLVPNSTTDPWEQLAERHRSSTFERRIVWVLKGANQDNLDRFSARLDNVLNQSGFFPEKHQIEDEEIWRIQYERLYDGRRQLLADRDRELLSRGAGTYLGEYRKFLFSPLGESYMANIKADPAGLFTRYFQSVIPTGTTGPMHSNPFTVFKTTDIDPTQLSFSRVAPLYALYVALRKEAREYDVNLHATGAPLYTSYAVVTAQREITTVGTVSILLIIVLCGTLFRSVRPLGLTLLAVSIGFLGGFAITLYLLGSVHILTLVFGATVIGIGADYSFHFLVHSNDHKGAKRPPYYVFRNLLLGLTSSVAAFLMLLTLQFPWLQQIGLFMAAGLTFCCLTVLILFPVAIGRRGIPIVVPPVIIPKLGDRKRYFGALTILVLVSLPGLFMLEPSDRISDLYAAPESLQIDERAILSAMPHRPETRYLLLRATNKEELLRAEERLTPQLGKLLKSNDLQGFSAISQYYPSRQRRRENAELQQELYKSSEFALFLEELGHPGISQETIAARLPSEDSPPHLFGAGHFLGCDKSTCASVLTLTGLDSPKVLTQLIESHTNAHLVDRIGAINQVLGTYRIQLQLAAGVVGAIVLLILAIVLGIRTAFQILLLPIATGLGAMACVGYLTAQYSIVNLLALLLLMGLSLDYAIFRSLTPEADHAPTSLAILISVSTSLLAFGLLAFSETTAISQFGITIGSGLILAWFLSLKMNSTINQK